jgi:tRNA pseudouridine38-40 synthase
MRTIRLLIAFDGTDFHGWQLQPDAPTIQGEIEKHLATIHNTRVPLHGAGRTDAGVHATGMVAHFHTAKDISCSVLQQSLNSMLPASIRILAATKEAESFHARFSAKSKTYIYSIFNGNILLPQRRLYSLHIRSPLNFRAMGKCLQSLEGTHDFSSFETAGSRDHETRELNGSTRTIYQAEIMHHSDNFHTVHVTGNGFLRHMVRNIVGTVLEVGLERRSELSFRNALQAKKRSAAGSTAPAHGLTLSKIEY